MVFNNLWIQRSLINRALDTANTAPVYDYAFDARGILGNTLKDIFEAIYLDLVAKGSLVDFKVAIMSSDIASISHHNYYQHFNKIKSAKLMMKHKGYVPVFYSDLMPSSSFIVQGLKESRLVKVEHLDF